MSISIQTNAGSLNAEFYIEQNQQFQTQAIQQLSSGYRINSSADDPAGLAVANQYAGEITQLTAGVQNATDGIGALQIADGGLNNISQILTRLQTLATEAASSTFLGNRATLNSEYQGLLTEINRQASNIGLNTGGANNTTLTVYTGGGTGAGNQVSVNLGGANNAVDSTALGIANTSIAGGGTGISGNSVRLDDSTSAFLTGTSQNFTFHLNTGSGNQDVTVTLSGGSSGLSGAQVISGLNNQLQAYGISASIGGNGALQFGGATAFTVSTTAAGTGAVSSTGTAINTANYNLSSGTFAAITAGAETFTVQNAGGSYNITLNTTTGATQTSALTAINNALAGSGIYAVTASNGTDITFQSSSAFSVNETATATTGSLFGTLGAQAVTAASSNASNVGNALAALNALSTAVSNLGLVQGQVGAGENKLRYATNLAQSQITSVSSAESGIRDADVAAAAANLTKAQVLQQTSLAALAQANAAPQAVLSLLKSLG